MRVTVSVFGRYHAFYLARELQERGHLQRLITTYPAREVHKYGLDPSYVCSLVAHEAASRVLRSAGRIIRKEVDLPFLLHEAFDRQAGRNVPAGCDIFVGWSSVSEHSLQRAREAGAVGVLERGSTHIQHQSEILREEYERHGQRVRFADPRVVEKELREYELADYICVPSTFAYRSFVARGFPGTKVIQVPYGVDLEAFRPRPKRDGVFRAIYAGAMSLRKGVQYLLKAFSELRLPRAELWLVGSPLPETRGIFAEYAGTFRHFPSVPQRQLADYYSQCSVFVMCSVEEGMAMVQAQAMASGLPLLCTTHTGGEDLIEDGREGFVVPVRDVNALKEKLLHLYEHEETRLAMGDAARRKAATLTWDHYGSRAVREYTRILTERAAAHV